MAEHRMVDAGRLIDAVSGFEAHFADALIIERDPALEDVDELEIECMPMLGSELLSGAADTNHLGMEAAIGGGGNAEIAIFKLLSEAAALETAIARARR